MALVDNLYLKIRHFFTLCAPLHINGLPVNKISVGSQCLSRPFLVFCAFFALLKPKYAIPTSPVNRSITLHF